MEGGSHYVAKKTSTTQEESKIQSNPEMRMLTLSSKGSSFYKLVEGETPTAARMELDKQYPQYVGAVTGKFAPYSGGFAVIVDQLGIHFVDMKSGKETRLIDQYQVNAISISPRDTYLVTCEKFVQGKHNLIIWSTQSGKEVAKFEWKKQSKEGPKSIKFSLDEKYCGRLSSKHHIELY